MGLNLTQIKGAVYRANAGDFGEDVLRQMRATSNKPDQIRKSISSLDEAVAETRARGISYGQLQTERRLAEVAAAEEPEAPVDLHHNSEADITTVAPEPEESKPAEIEPIDMLRAIDALITCSIACNSKITAVSAVDGEFADIAFVRDNITYVLSLRREEV